MFSNAEQSCNRRAPGPFWAGLFGVMLAVLLSAVSAAAQDGDPQAIYESEIEAARGQMMGDPPAALGHAERAGDLALALPEEARNTAIARAQWLQSEAMTRLGRPGEAKPLAEAALDRLGSEPVAKQLYADLLVSLGRASKLTGEHGRALKAFQDAYEEYRAISATRSEAITLQSIGSIYNDARQYERAIDYFDDSAQRFSDDAALDLAGYNNRANAYRELGEYEQARAQYEQALSLAEGLGSAMLEARILNLWVDDTIDSARVAQTSIFINGVLAQSGLSRMRKVAP